MRKMLLLLVGFAACSREAFAHEVRPAYLELRQIGLETYTVLWKVPARGEDLRLGLHVELPKGCTNVTAPRGSFANHAFTERWSVQCAGGLIGGAIHIAGLTATVTDVLARFERLDGTVHVTRLTPASPSFLLEAAPNPTQVAITYVKLGVAHILLGFDHLLFVFGLLLLVSSVKMLVQTITAFTVAHSLTLGLAALNLVHLPGPPVEAAIALSILLLATEIARHDSHSNSLLQREGTEGESPEEARLGKGNLTTRWPWAVAFCFGLLHGFGFAGALADIGLPQRDTPLALFTFNVGVELGQLTFVAVILGVRAVFAHVRRLELLLQRARPAASYGLGALAAFWFFQRCASF